MNEATWEEELCGLQSPSHVTGRLAQGAVSPLTARALHGFSSSYLGLHLICGANLSSERLLTEDPGSFNLEGLLNFWEIPSVYSRCLCFSFFAFPSHSRLAKPVTTPPLETFPSPGFGQITSHVEPLLASL